MISVNINGVWKEAIAISVCVSAGVFKPVETLYIPSASGSPIAVPITLATGDFLLAENGDTFITEDGNSFIVDSVLNNVTLSEDGTFVLSEDGTFITLEV